MSEQTTHVEKNLTEAAEPVMAETPGAETPGAETPGAGVSGDESSLTSDATQGEKPVAEAIRVGRPSRFRFENRLFVWFALALLFFSLFLLYRVFNPFINTIILACVFAAVCYPLYKTFLRGVGRKPLAAALVLLCWIVFVSGILVFFIAGLTPQAIQSVNSITEWLAGNHINAWGEEYAKPVLDWLQTEIPILDVESIDVKGSLLEASRRTGQAILSFGTYLVTNTVRLVIHFFIMLLIMFMLFIRGEGIMSRLEYLFPLKPEQTQGMLRSLQRTAKAVLVGGFLVAAAQGIAGGIGFAIVGLPALFWGTVMIFAAIVPAVGTGLVWVPAIVYMLIMGRWQSALFLLVWFGVGVSSIDTFLRPYLLRDGNNIPVVLLFLSIIGGLGAYGALGLLYGPMTLGFVAVMLDIYSQEFHQFLSGRQNGG